MKRNRHARSWSSQKTLLSSVSLLLVAAACSGSPEIIVDGDDSDSGGEGNDSDGSGGLVLDSDGGGGEGPVEPEVPWDCGDGNLEPGELCDDGNTEDADGCSADCQAQDTDYECTPGEECVRVVECGNGRIEGAEACDDGNEDDEDGCAGDCSEVEEGYSCPRPDAPCVLIPVCGNGLRERGEECDSGPSTDPGCLDCIQDPDFWCPVPGEECIEFECGNGFRTPGEACDDGNEVSGDGCADDCLTIETGWTCLATGCVPPCGDGVVQEPETCDSGATVGDPGSGCSATCRELPGFDCDEDGGACIEAECPNGEVEAGEDCDDDNSVAGDGCSPSCQDEPSVTRPGPNFDPVIEQGCGDGLKTISEGCDDGNEESGDGCSEDCDVEEGYDCDAEEEYPATVQLAVTYRDFIARDAEGGHPDFQWEPGPERRNMPGPVCTSTTTKCTAAAGAACPANTCGHLDADGKPVHHLTGNDSDRGRITSAATYALWYRDSNPTNLAGLDGPIEIDAIPGTLTLTRQGDETSDEYAFNSSDFFPIGRAPLQSEGFGWTCEEDGEPDCCDGANGSCDGKNFSFTTELRYVFVYSGGETLTFNGDDDVWVFVNGRHAVDIGGVHGVRWGRVVLGDDGDGDAADSNCSAHTTGQPGACALEEEEADASLSNGDTRFGLEKGKVYEIVLFHAERHTTASNFRLTLKGFLPPRSPCVSVCGDPDSHIAPGEICDDGPDNEDDTYGVCNTTCTSKPSCGDDVVQGPTSSPVAGPEVCDDGFNLDYYSAVFPPVGCAPGCTLPPYCGDGAVQSAEEDCDEALDVPDRNTGIYGRCNADCTWAPYCGDGTVQAEHEACDDPEGNIGYSDDGSGCGYDCQPAPFCGDGTRNGPEQCDLEDGNDGDYGGCNEDCTLAPRCGDEEVQSGEGEQCDDGPIGSLSCTPTCKRRQVVTR